MIEMKEWDGFEGRLWKEEINVRQFIQDNYTPYDGDESFLADPTDATNKLWDALQKLQKEERAKGGVLDMETEVVTGITAYGPGYIDESLKDLEQIVGLQTDKPLKRAFMPYGGIKMAVQAAETYGYNVSDKLKEIFTKYHKTHNTAVFDAYTPEMMKVRHAKILTGLPDTYGRGRIVGDYRRVALYGLDYLIEEKKKDKANCGCGQMTDDSRLPQDSGGDEGGILHNISGDRAQLLGGPPAGTGHQDGVKAALLGELDDLRSRAAEAQGGGRLIPGEHLGKGFHQ